MQNNPQLEAADKLAECVSLYLEGRADMDELKESAINYYSVHEKRLFEKGVGEMLLNAKPPINAPGESVSLNAFAMTGVKEYISNPFAEAMAEPMPRVICQGGTRRCEDCRCGLPEPDPQTPGWVKAAFEDSRPPAPSRLQWQGVKGFPVAPALKPLDPFPLPQRMLPEVRDGMYFRAECPVYSLFGQIRWDGISGRFFCYPQIQTDPAGNLIAKKDNA